MLFYRGGMEWEMHGWRRRYTGVIMNKINGVIGTIPCPVAKYTRGQRVNLRLRVHA